MLCFNVLKLFVLLLKDLSFVGFSFKDFEFCRIFFKHCVVLRFVNLDFKYF